MFDQLQNFFLCQQVLDHAKPFEDGNLPGEDTEPCLHERLGLSIPGLLRRWDDLRAQL